MVISENIQRLPTFGRLEGYTDTRFQAFLTNKGSIPSTRSSFPKEKFILIKQFRTKSPRARLSLISSLTHGSNGTPGQTANFSCERKPNSPPAAPYPPTKPCAQ